jgi:hypothetical protein
MDIAPGTPVRVKVITAGDEYSLEEKINEFLRELKSHEALAGFQVTQVEYHTRSGGVDTALLATLLIKG